MSITRCAAIAFISIMFSGFSLAANPPETPTITEFQIRYLDTSQAGINATGVQRAIDMNSRTGENFAHVRSGKSGGQVLRTNRKLTRAQAWEIATKMVHQGGLMYAEPIDPEASINQPIEPPSSLRPPAQRD